MFEPADPDDRDDPGAPFDAVMMGTAAMSAVALWVYSQSQSPAALLLTSFLTLGMWGYAARLALDRYDNWRSS